MVGGEGASQGGFISTYVIVAVARDVKQTGRKSVPAIPALTVGSVEAHNMTWQRMPRARASSGVTISEVELIEFFVGLVFSGF